MDQAKMFVEQLTADRFPAPSRSVLLDDTASNRYISTVDCLVNIESFSQMKFCNENTPSGIDI